MKDIIGQTDTYVNVTVFISMKKKINLANGDWRVMVADESGSIWAEFKSDTDIEGDQWYDLDNMEVHSLDSQIIIRETDLFGNKLLMDSKNKSYNFRPVSLK